MRVIITGGAGFIGSHLAERLLNEGNEVVVLDNLSTGSADNIVPLRAFDGFRFYDENIFNYNLMEEIIKDCDTIFHMAAAVGVKYIIENQVESIRTNIRGTEIILELAARYDKKVFLASSSEVYGKNERRILNEEDDSVLGGPSIPRWSYGHSKAIDEFLALAYYREIKLRVVVARFFNTCGPRQVGRYGMVIPRFVRQALKGDPMTVYGTGRQVRSFNHVFDTLDGVMALMETPEAEGDVFNIGSSEGITMMKLAKKVRDMTDSSSEIKLVPYEEVFHEGFEDMMYRVPDLTKLSHTIEYKPKYDLTRLLETTIEHIRNEKEEDL